jgi:hypothetical protein
VTEGRVEKKKVIHSPLRPFLQPSLPSFLVVGGEGRKEGTNERSISRMMMKERRISRKMIQK